MTQNEGVCLMQDPSRGCHRTDETVQYVCGKIKTMFLGSKVGNISPALLEASAATHWTLPDRATIAYDWDQCQRRAVTAMQVWVCKIFDHNCHWENATRHGVNPEKLSAAQSTALNLDFAKKHHTELGPGFYRVLVIDMCIPKDIGMDKRGTMGERAEWLVSMTCTL